jgi:hypothetical protein
MDLQAKQAQDELLERWREKYPPSSASTKLRARLLEPEVRDRMQTHLNVVLARFRPDLEQGLIQELPLWYAANFLCLKWLQPAPPWLETVSQKYIRWVVAKEFRSKDPKDRAAVDEFFEITEIGMAITGRHKNAGTAALDLLEDIRTFLAFEVARLANEHFARGLKNKDLVILLTDHLSISPETLKARRKRAKRFYDEPQSNSDVMIFGVDFNGISRIIR